MIGIIARRRGIIATEANMEDSEKMFWDLFCATGEPRYYSMYVKLRDGKKRKK